MAPIIVEQCRVSASHHKAASVRELSLPLTFLDMMWYDFIPDQSVLLYEFPSSKSDFLETIVPDLKKSLSLTLAHFLPLSGNIIHPGRSSGGERRKPVVRYKREDSVSLTVTIYDSEHKDNFLKHLSGNHPRVSSEFHCLAPQLPPATCSDDGSIECPVLALHVTLFPGQGICIGFVTHHAVADACTVVSFMRAWALIHKLNKSHADDETKAQLIKASCFMSYDREEVVDVNGWDSIYRNWILKTCLTPVHHVYQQPKSSLGKHRCTFVLKRDEIEKLKMYVSAKQRPLDKAVKNHLSSFVVTCALIWICFAKSADALEGAEVVADDEPEYFGFLVDCRGRVSNPPLPENYFGNCVAPIVVDLKHGELKGNDGFAMAVESIGEAIREKVRGFREGILESAPKWPEYRELAGKRQHWVAGSPRFDFYGVDFGWGKPNKFEGLFTDNDEAAILFSKSRDFEGGLEIGLSKPKPQMEAYTTVFTKVLADIYHYYK